MNNMISALCAVIVVALLSACSIGGSAIPEDHYYRLPEVSTEKQLKTPFQNLLIKPVRVAGLYHERSLLYVETDSPLELRRYHYHYWVEPPALLLTKQIQAYFKARDHADHSSLAPSQSAAVIMVPRLLNFERLVGPAGIEVLVRLEFVLQHQGAGQRDWTQIYSAQVPVDSVSMHDTVRAFGAAIDQTIQALNADLLKLAEAQG